MSKHFPCGHWHKVPISWDTTIPTPLNNAAWYSCPGTVLYGNNTNDIWFITTDHRDPTSTMYVIRYNRAYNTWTTLYTTTKTDDGSVDYRWTEPTIASVSSGAVSVVVLQTVDVDYNDVYDVYVFNGETLLTNAILTGVGVTDLSVPTSWPHFATIDAAGNIHIITQEAISGTAYTYDYISADGVTFTPVQVGSFTGAYAYASCKPAVFTDASDNIWVFATGGKLYESVDHGANWSLISTLDTSALPTAHITWMKDAIFLNKITASTTKIYRSEDGVNWTEVLSFDHTYPRGGVFVHDGTYYYAIFNYRNDAGNVAGHNHVYRSDDGETWASLSEFTDDALLGPTDQASFDIDVSGTSIVCTYYYASTLQSGTSDVYFMCVWESTDRGVTWTNIQTPFYDLTTGEAP